MSTYFDILAAYLHNGSKEMFFCTNDGKLFFRQFTQTHKVTLALKPRGDITRNEKQGYQLLQIGHVYVSVKNIKK